MVRQMLAVAARRSRLTHARVPIRYNMVRTRSRKSCVRGKPREKTGTEYRHAVSDAVRRIALREIPLWGSRRFVRSIIIYVDAGVYRVHAHI